MNTPNREWIERAAAIEDDSDPSIPQSDIIGGFPFVNPNCRGCGKPLTIENAWMTDGCPCNTALGVNNFNETRWRLLMMLQQRQSHDLEKLRTAVRSLLSLVDLRESR